MWGEIVSGYIVEGKETGISWQIGYMYYEREFLSGIW